MTGKPRKLLAAAGLTWTVVAGAACSRAEGPTHAGPADAKTDSAVVVAEAAAPAAPMADTNGRPLPGNVRAKLGACGAGGAGGKKL